MNGLVGKVAIGAIKTVYMGKVDGDRIGIQGHGLLY
jgi:hypothetical protein